jgi:hypothetical protein
MPDQKRYTEKTEVTTETSDRSGTLDSEENTYKKETTVKTERKVEKDDDTVVIVQNK